MSRTLPSCRRSRPRSAVRYTVGDGMHLVLWRPFDAATSERVQPRHMPMKWIGKVTGGLLGGLALGPFGAALGVLLGHQFDEMSTEEELPASEQLAAIGARFFRASFHVVGYLAQADGRVSEREIAAARAVMDELRLDGARVREAIDCFTAGKQPDYDYGAELTQLKEICRGRPDLARVFLEIQVRAALEGNDLIGPVRALIGRLASALGVSTLEF